MKVAQLGLKLAETTAALWVEKTVVWLGLMMAGSKVVLMAATTAVE